MWPCRVICILALSACARQPEPETSPALTSHGAAALAVLQRGDSGNGPLIVVTTKPVPLLEQDLSVLAADSVWLWQSDNPYGGQRRFSVLPDSYYVLLDLREIGNSGDTAWTFTAMLERCPGWPCHEEYRIRVRRDSAGFVPDWVRLLTIE